MKVTETIKKQITKTKPIWLMRQAGRYLPEYLSIRSKHKDFMEMCCNKEEVVKITLQPLKRFDLDAAIIFSDILLILNLMGLKVKFKDGPSVAKVTPEQCISMLDLPKKELLPVLGAISDVRKKLDREKDLIGFAGAPWTVASYIFEADDRKSFTNIRALAYKKRGVFKEIIDRLAEITADYLIMQLEGGADLLQIFDSWAGVLPEDEFEEWVIRPTARIVELVRAKHPQAIIIGFAKSSGLNVKKYTSLTGISALALDYTVPIRWAAENLELPLQGNLDPVLLANDLDLALEHTRKILEITRDRVFVFNLGHGVLPNTPVDHVKKLVDFVKDYSS
ncbi:uroporphyrinogen decarboxylase [Rickettsiales bacterium]|nr:uroporphyrinogen decarboxylase [Rickettsiales bacterium]